MSLQAWRLLAMLAVGGVAFFVVHPIALFGVGVLAVLFIIFQIADRGRLQRLKQERSNESICKFVRALDYRTLDTWIIRAVYEEFDAFFDGEMPLRPSDSFAGELNIDLEDVIFFAEDIAQRCGRSMIDIEENPLYGRVNTLEDLIMCFHHQPRLNAA